MISALRADKIVVQFLPRFVATLGDHPLVIYDCMTKKARYMEGE